MVVRRSPTAPSSAVSSSTRQRRGRFGQYQDEVRLSFDSQDEALAYAKRNGFETHIGPAPPFKLR